jgi:UDP-N-acetylglucosamine 4,6-dehydratase
MRILVVGGTGTLGKELLRQLPDEEIYVISRDELKQQELKKVFKHVKFTIGCIRDYNAMRHALCDIKPEIVFHAAALKHVDVCQENPSECMLTNYMGVENVHKAALEAGVKVMALSSTDKAVLPITVYGNAKNAAEHYLFNANSSNSPLTNVVFRYGNVLGSRGSVIQSFAKTLREEKKVYITDHRMTRFWLPIEKAVGFMLEMTRKAYNGQLDSEDLLKPMIPDIRALPVIEIARIVSRVVGVPDFTVEEIGIRGIEKIHEVLYSSHEHCITSEKATQCNIDEFTSYIEGVLNES